MESLHQNKTPTLLLGVTYALLDFCEIYSLDWPELVVMETGGMKGQREEMTKPSLHAALKKLYGVPAIHSEYGMTELLSQAYSTGEGRFLPMPGLHAFTRAIDDPMSEVKYGKSGRLCFIDMANKDSCAFIATDDIGVVYADGSFEVLGRIEGSEIRGCNLLLEELSL